MEAEKSINFEDKIEEAKKYLDILVQPDITLSDSVDAYKKGLRELEEAKKILEEARLEFETINKSED
jgi:exodeoxyribonuclease VII small subunit